jgi:hypothetical protein
LKLGPTPTQFFWTCNFDALDALHQEQEVVEVERVIVTADYPKGGYAYITVPNIAA